MSEYEEFEETDIAVLLNHPYDDPTQAIICSFPDSNQYLDISHKKFVQYTKGILA